MSGILRGILFDQIPALTITQGPLKLLSGQLLIPDGAASAPSLAFSSETALGWYRYGPGLLGLSAGKHLWMPNGSTIFARNFADNSNKSLLYLNGSDKIVFGEGGVDILMGSDNVQDIGASGLNRPRSGYFGTSVVAPSILFSSLYGMRMTGTTLTLDAGSLDINSLAIGPLPATVGVVRLANGATIQARNAANTGNLAIMTLTGGNILLVGESGLAGITLDKAVIAASTLTVASTLTAQGGINSQTLNIRSLTEPTTIAAAATTDTAIQIPANAVVLCVSVRVITAIPTAATFTVTGATSATTFSTAAVSTALNSTDVGTASMPYKNGAAQAIRITPNLVPAAATGVVRVTIQYYDVTPPTS